MLARSSSVAKLGIAMTLGIVLLIMSDIPGRLVASALEVVNDHSLEASGKYLSRMSQFAVMTKYANSWSQTLRFSGSD